ncbi:MAG TPA: prepilin-type N-terminal cleavage/methylation domain-containing protein [Candidatus Tectomicrobia bacterium]|jgi:type II secretion system protein J
MPRSKHPHRCQPAGFTLIEILLALVMFAMIAGVIFASFAAVMDGVEKGRQSADFYRIGRGALQRMTQEISAAVGPEVEPRAIFHGEKDTTATRRRDRITFVAIPYRRHTARVPEDELCSISYYLTEDTRGRPTLFRTEDCTLDAEQEEDGTVLGLTDLVVGLEITYYDAVNEYDSWPLDSSAENTLPCQVRVALTLRDDRGYERVFFTTVPLLMRGTCENTAVTVPGEPGGTPPGGASGTPPGGQVARPQQPRR